MADECIIFWWNPTGSREWEEFESLEEAEVALTEWEKAYPWNTYTLANIVRRVDATQASPHGGIFGWKLTN